MKSRRSIILILFACLCTTSGHCKSGKGRLADRIGVCTGLSNAALVKEAGGHHLELNLSSFTVPEKDEATFKANLESAAASVLPTPSTNGFFPGDIRLTGPDTDQERALRYTEVALRRAKEAGIKVAVLGSGTARNIPEGFPREKGEEQFVELLKKMGPIAKKYGIIIAIEPLRKKECNFINTVQEGYEIAKRVNHPNVCVNADIYHMMQEGEGPESILNAGRKYIRNVHIAENANRTAPGVDGDDFTPYFQALKKIKYQGNISIECGWSDFKSQVGPAIQELKRQLELVYR